MSTALWLIASHAVAVTVGAVGMYQYVQFLNRHMQQEVTPMPTPEARRRRRNATVSAFLVILIIIAAYGVWDQRRRADDRDHFTECINNYTTLQHAAQTARSDATESLQTAQQALLDRNRALWALVSRQLSTGKQIPKTAAVNALGRYLVAASRETHMAAHLQHERDTHPYPEPPERACS